MLPGASAWVQALSSKPESCQAVPWSEPSSRYLQAEPAETQVAGVPPPPPPPVVAHVFCDGSRVHSASWPSTRTDRVWAALASPLSEMVGARVARFPASGEINRRLDDPAAALERVRERYRESALRIDETDGVGIEFDLWRFNLRLSNTEPLIRLNVESRGDEALMRQKTDEVLAVLEQEQAAKP